MSREPLVVIGIGPEGPAGLSPVAQEHIRRAGVLAGGKRHLDLFPDWPGHRVVIDADLDGLVAGLRRWKECEKTVVLASGDPLFYGIGRRLLEAFPREELEFFPHLSSVQLAFARIKETWQDACVVSLHGRPLASLLSALRRGESKIALLTDAGSHPAAIARFAEEHASGDFDFFVCENLGASDERVTRWTAAELAGQTFSPLNVVVLLRRQSTAPRASLPLLGIPESSLQHRPGPRGMITRREVRLMALAYLELHAGETLWDVGAGSGSVAIEAARLSPQLQVVAVERDADGCRMLRENVRALGIENVRIVEGEAPQALAGLPAPNAVFIGGSGGKLADLLAAVVERLTPGGRIVLSCITLETLTLAWGWLQSHSLEPVATSVQLAHSRPLGSLSCLEPDLPLFLVQASKR
jgi:precorrin-6Y C5,15-methyltransferase (decarboxylating)